MPGFPQSPTVSQGMRCVYTHIYSHSDMCIHSHIFPTLDIFLSIASEEANTRISRLQSCDLAALEGTGKQRLKRRKIILPCILGGLGRKSGTGGMWTNTGRKASALIRSPSTCLGHSRMDWPLVLRSPSSWSTAWILRYASFIRANYTQSKLRGIWRLCVFFLIIIIILTAEPGWNLQGMQQVQQIFVE